jgi:small GTP-binding protein
VTLDEYERAKFALADILRGLGGLRPGSKELDAVHLRSLFARLSEDRFNLVVVGRFNRGKTTLMNAMLGMDCLPMGVVPLTSVITSVTYGSEPKVVLHYRHTSLFMDIPLEQLAEHVTERGNPGNARGISVADVQLPSDILRHGFRFVDTPGLGSTIAENTRTTEGFLPESDALLLITSYDSPLSEEEERVLHQGRAAGKRVFIVLNKQDTARPADRDEVAAHMARQLTRIYGGDPPPVFSLSASQALAARLRRDANALAESGLPRLEDTVIRFLVEERQRELLAAMCRRIDALLQQAGSDELAGRLAQLRLTLDHAPAPAAATAAPMPPSVPAFLPRCEICEALANAGFQFFAHFQSALYTDPRTRSDLAERGGLCVPHLRYLGQIAALREIAVGLSDVVGLQAAELRARAGRGRGGPLAGEPAGESRRSDNACPACAALAPVRTNALAGLARLAARQGAAAVQHRSALCMPHFAGLLDLVADPALRRDLLDGQAGVLQRLEEDARRFALRQDAAQRYAASKEELTAAQRVLEMLAVDPRAEMASDTQRAPGVGSGTR